MLMASPFLFVSERDAFDALFDNAPEKLNVVKKVQCTSAFNIELHVVSRKEVFLVAMQLHVSLLCKGTFIQGYMSVVFTMEIYVSQGTTNLLHPNVKFLLVISKAHHWKVYENSE